MNSRKQSSLINICKLICAFMVITIHTGALSVFSDTADFVLTSIIDRVAVPFFIMVTGYYVIPKALKHGNAVIGKYILKIFIVYLAATVLYIPINIYAHNYSDIKGIGGILKMFIMDGTYFHLWYFPAIIIGVFIGYVLIKKTDILVAIIVSVVLYIIGLGGDSYYGIVSNLKHVKKFYDFIFKCTDYTRNGFFYVPIFVVLGYIIYKLNRKSLMDMEAEGQDNHSRKRSNECFVATLVISYILMFAEALILHSLDVQKHTSMYILLPVVMFSLFSLVIRNKDAKLPNIIEISAPIYVFHPFMIVVVRLAGKVTHTTKYVVDNSLIHTICVMILTTIVAIAFNYIVLVPLKKYQKKKQENSEIEKEYAATMEPAYVESVAVKDETKRAWIDVNLGNLAHNVKVISDMLPEGCKFMAVVKANAYGHGSTVVSRYLNGLGVDSFAVATLEEGIELRANGVEGLILILGYTASSDFKELYKYKLTQTVVDYNYAKELNSFGKPILVHIKLDTGMNRLGERYDNIENLEKIFKLKNLRITGTFSHLCVADSKEERDIEFTKQQIDRFMSTIDALKEKGLNPGKLHLQSSYGIINYPDLKMDYARIGIILYGAMSDISDIDQSLNLKPVLQIKATIASIKEVEPGDTVGYGRTFEVRKNMRIADVTIGYADGLPRNVAEHNGYVLINGHKAAILGRICMDQMVVDVTDIKDAHQGDTVVIIGSSNDEVISVEDIASEAQTITNELLSRLGDRLPRYYSKS